MTNIPNLGKPNREYDAQFFDLAFRKLERTLALLSSELNDAKNEPVTFSIGPFYINDMAGTTTTDATLAYFDSATTVARSANEVKMDVAGRIVGVIIVSDDARTAGTATVAVEVNNTTKAFNSGAVQLNGTNTTSDSSFVAYTSGVPFAAGDTVGCEVTTSGWTPTTANFNITLIAQLE